MVVFYWQYTTSLFLQVMVGSKCKIGPNWCQTVQYLLSHLILSDPKKQKEGHTESIREWRKILAFGFCAKLMGGTIDKHCIEKLECGNWIQIEELWKNTWISLQNIFSDSKHVHCPSLLPSQSWMHLYSMYVL